MKTPIGKANGIVGIAIGAAVTYAFIFAYNRFLAPTGKSIADLGKKVTTTV